MQAASVLALSDPSVVRGSLTDAFASVTARHNGAKSPDSFACALPLCIPSQVPFHIRRFYAYAENNTKINPA